MSAVLQTQEESTSWKDFFLYWGIDLVISVLAACVVWIIAEVTKREGVTNIPDSLVYLAMLAAAAYAAIEAHYQGVVRWLLRPY
jgi:hypothetical protein